MPFVEYRYRKADQERTAPYPRVRDALAVAIRHLHDGDAVAIAISYAGRLLLDAAAIVRVYAASSSRQAADYWRRPRALEAAARRELTGRPARARAEES